jgi:two-component sensor histidine kinase
MDVTERVRAEEQRRLLMTELSHRTKNLLAIVRSIAMQSLRDGGDPARQRALFEQRLAALARANDILVREEWERARLAELVEEAARACGVDPARVEACGPDILLPPQRALTMTLALHELFTNAVKYGALSAARGRVLISWQARADDPGGFRLAWTERGGPPVVVPRTEGFGSRMLTRALAAELGGPVRLDYASDGLVCEILAASPPALAGGNA